MSCPLTFAGSFQYNLTVLRGSPVLDFYLRRNFKFVCFICSVLIGLGWAGFGYFFTDIIFLSNSLKFIIRNTYLKTV